MKNTKVVPFLYVGNVHVNFCNVSEDDFWKKNITLHL